MINSFARSILAAALRCLIGLTACRFRLQNKASMMAEAGLEKTQDLMGNTHLVAKSAAESGAILNDSALADNYLAEVVAAWSTLTEITRQAILNLVHDARRTNV
jgi:hypothetical protein